MARELCHNSLYMQGYSRMLTKFPPGRISGARVQDGDEPGPWGHGQPDAEASVHSDDASADEGGGNALQNADRAEPPRGAEPGTAAQQREAAAAPPAHQRIHSPALRLRPSQLRLLQPAHRLH